MQSISLFKEVRRDSAVVLLPLTLAFRQLVCENSRFPPLLAAGDVSRGGTSATHRKKFLTDDVKSVCQKG